MTWTTQTDDISYVSGFNFNYKLDISFSDGMPPTPQMRSSQRRHLTDILLLLPTITLTCTTTTTTTTTTKPFQADLDTRDIERGGKSKSLNVKDGIIRRGFFSFIS
jgi:hypothetical protein